MSNAIIFTEMFFLDSFISLFSFREKNIERPSSGVTLIITQKMMTLLIVFQNLYADNYGVPAFSLKVCLHNFAANNKLVHF